MYRADVEKLLEVTGSTQLANQFMSIFTRQFVDGFKRAQPSMPDRALEVLLAFCSTDLGKKVIVSTPLILQEGATVGQQWAEKQMPRIGSLLEARLRAEGFIK